jgi:hypothetical protein
MGLWDSTFECVKFLVSFFPQHLVNFLFDGIKSIENNVLKLIIFIIDLLNDVLIMSDFGFWVVSRFDSKRLFNIRNLT